MNQKVSRYSVKPFPKARQMIVDVLELGRRKHFIHGLVEVDVTQARRLIHEYENQTGNDLSFSAFIIACLVLFHLFPDFKKAVPFSWACLA